MTTVEIKRINFYLLQAPIADPVRTSFAVMRHRPALLARVENADGAVGWGEIWCNHPPLSGRLRMALAEEVIAPMVVARTFSEPGLVYSEMMATLHILSIQTGEPGPYAQVVAGLEAAVFDMMAQVAGQPLSAYLTGASATSVRAYASGINPGDAVKSIEKARAGGFRDFKIKVGFEDKTDLQVVRDVADTIQTGERFMLDANQGWSTDHALELTPQLNEFGPCWLEEPIPADSPIDDWKRLRDRGAPPLAGGENLMDHAFDVAIGSPAYTFVQPDVAKWGGVSGCLRVGQQTLAAGKTYCPHFLGAAPGLLASAHVLAAVGGGGLLEVDVNENPLRDQLGSVPITCDNGKFNIPEGDGIGFEPDASVMTTYLIAEAEVSS